LTEATGVDYLVIESFVVWVIKENIYRGVEQI
jgi:hypothetical protein